MDIDFQQISQRSMICSFFTFVSHTTPSSSLQMSITHRSIREQSIHTGKRRLRRPVRLFSHIAHFRVQLKTNHLLSLNLSKCQLWTAPCSLQLVTARCRRRLVPRRMHSFHFPTKLTKPMAERTTKTKVIVSSIPSNHLICQRMCIGGGGEIKLLSPSLDVNVSEERRGKASQFVCIGDDSSFIHSWRLIRQWRDE